MKNIRFFAATIVIVALSLYGWQQLSNSRAPSSKTTHIATPCPLTSGSCTSQLPNGSRVKLSLSPAPIPLVKPLHITVSIEGIDASLIEVVFIGINMDMGFNRTKLNVDTPNQFSGIGMLPVCIQQKMRWEAQVVIQTKNDKLSVPFHFSTQR